MKFYCLRNSIDVKIIGHDPQVVDIKYRCDLWDEPRFIEHTHFKQITFDPITANAILHPKAAVTDLISVVGMGFTLKPLISGKLKNILNNNRDSGLQFFSSPVIYRNISLEDYWTLNFFETNMEYIDFGKSNVIISKRRIGGGTHQSSIKIHDLSHFKRLLEEDNLEGKLYVNKIVLNNLVSRDFFLLRNVEGGAKYVVSEKLKYEMEDVGCTGIEFQPIELSLAEWLNEGERTRIYGNPI